MNTNVYNIVWADDEIDDLLDDETIRDLKLQGFNMIGYAHNGKELESILKNQKVIDAVIIDANFNESDKKIESERDTSGLNYARSLYNHKLNRSIPFFLFTGRSDELLKEIYKYNEDFLDDFPRHKRWFSKTLQDEFNDMLEEIKTAVNESKSTGFIVRNKYKDELSAAYLFDSVYGYILDFLERDYDNTLEEIKEPFVTVRRTIEKVFSQCERMKLIPPISDDTNGTSAYLFKSKYCVKDESKQYIPLYEMLDKNIMPKPLACSLSYIVNITQDASHSKDKLKLKVDEYFEETKDVLLLRSVVYILMDILKWFAITALNHKDEESNELVLWHKISY